MKRLLLLIFLLAGSPGVGVTGIGLLDICAKQGMEQACTAYIGGYSVASKLAFDCRIDVYA